MLKNKNYLWKKIARINHIEVLKQEFINEHCFLIPTFYEKAKEEYKRVHNL